MTGGTIIYVTPEKGFIRLLVEGDSCDGYERRPVDIEPTNRVLRVGDRVWWQAGLVMLNATGSMRRDIRLHRSRKMADSEKA